MSRTIGILLRHRPDAVVFGLDGTLVRVDGIRPLTQGRRDLSHA